jgi:hypothetical protein
MGAARAAETDLPVPRNMLGTWVLTDTWQCANTVGKLVITPAGVQFGGGKPIPVRFAPRSGPHSGDALHWRTAKGEQTIEYDPANDRVVWQAKDAGKTAPEIYERCTP